LTPGRLGRALIAPTRRRTFSTSAFLGEADLASAGVDDSPPSRAELDLATLAARTPSATFGVTGLAWGFGIQARGPRHLPNRPDDRINVGRRDGSGRN